MTEHAGKQDICIIDHCGNGVVDPSEACDDGNQIAGDGCSSDCRSAELCGNGIVDFTVGEVCDDGNTQDDDTCCADCRSCLELAVDLHAITRKDPPDPPPPTPACNPAELQRALADLDAARSRADQAMAQAGEAIKRARARSRRAIPKVTTEQADDAQQIIEELRQHNAELLVQLQSVQERLAMLERRPLNGRSARLD